MRTVNIKLPTNHSVQEFVAQISKLSGQFDLLSGKYVLDAKSLMGIFSLDLSRPLTLRIEKDTAGTMQVIDRFLAQRLPEGKEAGDYHVQEARDE